MEEETTERGDALQPAMCDFHTYAVRYCDLSRVFGDDLSRYERHWMQEGQLQQRNCGPDPNVWDPVAYADRYPDVRALHGYDPDALWRHYVTVGIRELRYPGRDPSQAAYPPTACLTTYPAEDYQTYAVRYCDLVQKFEADLPKYQQHWLNQGAKEQRSCTADPNVWDPVAYMQRYPEVRAAVGSDPVALWKHYVTIGWRQQLHPGRDPTQETYPATACPTTASMHNQQPTLCDQVKALSKQIQQMVQQCPT